MGQVSVGGAADGRGRAVVVGGGIAGMLAARVLAKHFGEVVILERDRYPEDEGNRPGVPQARHLHFLLKRGLMVMEEQFPGFTADLLAAGCPQIDQGKDFRILYRTGWAPHVACGLDIVTFTRPLFEATMRRHLMRHDRVACREEVEVMGLALDASGARVDGVRLRSRAAGAAGAEEILPADLVVDASGRYSRAPEWLAAAGFPAPPETVVDAMWGYATRLYEPVPGFECDWRTSSS